MEALPVPWQITGKPSICLDVQFIEFLEDFWIYATDKQDALRKNRLRSADKLLPTDQQTKIGPKETTSVATKRNVTIIKWHDRAPMLVASTCSGKEP